MESESTEYVIKPLLLIGGRSSRMGARKELLQFPDGSQAFEHALHTLHSAVPSAPTIYVSLHDESQLAAIQFKLDKASAVAAESKVVSDDHHHDHISNPEFMPIFDAPGHDIGPAAGLIAARYLFLDATWMVLGCGYPLLPPTALQQLVLEYEAPVTCFINNSGFAEPLIAIWGPEALSKLKDNAKKGVNVLSEVVKQVQAR